LFFWTTTVPSFFFRERNNVRFKSNELLPQLNLDVSSQTSKINSQTINESVHLLGLQPRRNFCPVRQISLAQLQTKNKALFGFLGTGRF
jgi:hypothetical protein